MQNPPNKGNSAGAPAKAKREERLAAELRANLKRRKAAARARAADPLASVDEDADPPGDDAAPPASTKTSS